MSTDSKTVFTACFCGTACTRDEGEVTREDSNKKIYTAETGYIPVRLHKEISNTLNNTNQSCTVRGVGENDWAHDRGSSEALKFDGPLKPSSDLLDYVASYSGGDQRSKIGQATGWAATALALHGANLAAQSGASTINLMGHSRGGVECIMAAWFLYAYGFKNIPVNILAIDPVPGKGEWYGILTQLPPNVVNYTGIYAWDHLDMGFTPVVPRPNGQMTGVPKDFVLGSSWKTLADNYQQDDPLAIGDLMAPVNYTLYTCRGKHSTVSGNAVADGYYNPEHLSKSVAAVPKLIYKIARGYLTQWGTVFQTPSAVQESTLDLRKKIHTEHRDFDLMGGGETRTSMLPLRPYVRQISASSGRNLLNTFYMEDVVGDPPYKLAYPVTNQRASEGRVKWKFL